MKKLTLFLLIFSCCVGKDVMAQDTLPKFSIRNIGNNRIVMGWVNKFETIRQISIQRSFDSLSNYKTILTVADPTTPENGYVDTKAANDHMFYRLYIVFDKGSYIFSSPRRPVLDTMVKKFMNSKVEGANLWVPIVDSVNGLSISNNRIRSDTWIASRYIYTSRDGYIKISLPEALEKKYNIKFFTNENEFLFELKDVKEKEFKLEKSNFYRAGWFKFEMYEDGVLKEKNKFYLPKEF